MRSAIYGVIFTAFLASAGIVQAGVLDGKSLFCTNTSDKTHPVYGLVFEQGEVTRWQVDGFSKKNRMKVNPIRSEEPDMWSGIKGLVGQNLIDRHSKLMLTNVQSLLPPRFSINWMK
jgi:hypothetical protein